MARFFTVLAILVTALFSFGQAPRPAGASTASVSGIVVKDPGSEPLKKVLVQIIAENQTAAGTYTASTDAEGRFHAEQMEPGRYQIFLEKSGFAAVNERGNKSEVSVVTLQSGQSLGDLVLRMQPTAVISGRVTDEDGDPMAEVRIIAQLQKPGKTNRETVGSTSTNDLGEYRLAGLFAGKYLISAVPPPDFRDYEKTAKPSSSTASPDPQDSARSETRYLATYYPGTFDVAQASLIALKAGDDVPVSLTLAPSRTFRVRGIVTAISATDKPTVELRSKSGESVHAAPEVASDGQFEVRGVAPGAYTLIASSGSEAHPLSAKEDITVVSGDVSGVKLVPAPTFSLSGHLRVERKSSSSITQYAVNLRPAHFPDNSSIFMSQDVFGTNAAVDEHGNFQWSGIVAGNYLIQVFGGERPGKYFLKSASMGGQEIDTGFQANGPAIIDVVISYNGGEIAGTVSQKSSDSDNARAASNTIVVAVPEEKYRTLPDRFATGVTDQNGHFTVSGLPPGNYTVFAWQDIDENIYRDPEFLRAQAPNGKAVKVEPGSRQQIDLSVSTLETDFR